MTIKFNEQRGAAPDAGGAVSARGVCVATVADKTACRILPPSLLPLCAALEPCSTRCTARPSVPLSPCTGGYMKTRARQTKNKQKCEMKWKRGKWGSARLVALVSLTAQTRRGAVGWRYVHRMHDSPSLKFVDKGHGTLCIDRHHTVRRATKNALKKRHKRSIKSLNNNSQTQRHTKSDCFGAR